MNQKIDLKTAISIKMRALENHAKDLAKKMDRPHLAYFIGCLKDELDNK